MGNKIIPIFTIWNHLLLSQVILFSPSILPCMEENEGYQTIPEDHADSFSPALVRDQEDWWQAVMKQVLLYVHLLFCCLVAWLLDWLK